LKRPPEISWVWAIGSPDLPEELGQILTQISALLAMVSARIGSMIAHSELLRALAPDGK